VLADQPAERPLRSDQPATIEDHALIGDTRTAALVTARGEIDWLCAPRFESPPIFGSLIGGPQGGRFAISPLDARRTSRRYREGSTLLETTWETGTGVARLTDGMVADVSRELLPALLLIRRLDAVEGHVNLEVVFDPRRHMVEPPVRTARRAQALFVEWGSLAVTLRTEPDLAIRPGNPASLRVERGETVSFVVAVADRAPGILVRPAKAWESLMRTDAWWRRWSEAIAYDGPMFEAVARSLITLRLLTYAPSGAPVAAPTTSLPERIGGDLNWDYRFSWPRDASLGLRAFLGTGHRDEPRAFLRWLTIASRLSRPRVDVLYDLHGRPGIDEEERWDLPGYRGSNPVRVGNAACKQHQLDVYGWIVDAAWRLHRAGEELDGEVWRAVQGWADHVCRRWGDPDAGIWETRGPPAHHVHSKLMAWMALDRALELGRHHRLRSGKRRRWELERAALADDIRRHALDPDRGVYRGRYGSADLDAALLLLPQLGWEERGARQVRATVETIRSELDAGGGLLYRSPSDEKDGGAFLACSFWMVEALCSLGLLDEAAELFESLCARANDVGLFAEEMDPATGAHLGNFPLALTHSSLIAAALAVSDALRVRSGSPA
jgi:GH15 family glucan-1,4-alpha-glucosidase